MLLSKRSAKIIDAGVALNVERARAVGDGVQVGRSDGRSGEPGEYSSHVGFYGGCERQIDPLLKKRGDRANPLRNVA